MSEFSYVKDRRRTENMRRLTRSLPIKLIIAAIAAYILMYISRGTVELFGYGAGVYFMISVYQYLYLKTDGIFGTALFGTAILGIYYYLVYRLQFPNYVVVLPPIIDLGLVIRLAVRERCEKKEDENKIDYEAYRGNFNYSYNKADYQNFNYAGRKNESTGGTGFFQGCRTAAEYKKRYKQLCKEFHPDNTKTGDRAKFERLQKEYKAYQKKR